MDRENGDAWHGYLIWEKFIYSPTAVDVLRNQKELTTHDNQLLIIILPFPRSPENLTILFF